MNYLSEREVRELRKDSWIKGLPGVVLLSEDGRRVVLPMDEFTMLEEGVNYYGELCTGAKHGLDIVGYRLEGNKLNITIIHEEDGNYGIDILDVKKN